MSRVFAVHNSVNSMLQVANWEFIPRLVHVDNMSTQHLTCAVLPWGQLQRFKGFFFSRLRMLRAPASQMHLKECCLKIAPSRYLEFLLFHSNLEILDVVSTEDGCIRVLDVNLPKLHDLSARRNQMILSPFI